MTRTLIAEIPVGIRAIAGTDHPVVDQLWRTGPRSWEVVREICRGVPRSAKTYRSREAAEEAFSRRLDGAKPRAGEPASIRIAIRVTPAEHEAARSEAAREGRTISDWYREAGRIAIAGTGGNDGGKEPTVPSVFVCTACGKVVGRWEDMEEYQHRAPCFGLIVQQKDPV